LSAEATSFSSESREGTLAFDSSGDSGVLAYTVGDDFIKVRFRHSPKIYVYDRVKPGPLHVGKMKKLAATGKNLSTYISQHVKENYSRIEA
jgi:hypothetical protein